MRIHVAAIGLLAVLASGATTAHAASSGYLRGRLSFYQANGGYCPTGRDCTGARYLESEYLTNRPIRDAKVYLKDAGTGALLGVGVTDVNGNYILVWSSPITAPSFSAQIYWKGEHKDLRFYLTQAGGAFLWQFTSGNFNLISGTNQLNPQVLGDITWGSAGNANKLVNAYHAAWHMWNYALDPSARMRQRFTGLQVRGIYDGAASNWECERTCAVPGQNFVKIGNGEAFSQGAVMHEIAHVASHVANHRPWHYFDMCYPLACSTTNYDACCLPTDPNRGHAETTTEWLSVAFEEGFANAVGAAAFYTRLASTPIMCNIASAPCPLASYNYESSTMLCTATMRRRELHVGRYLWDLYDDHNDDWFTDDVTRPSVSFFYDVLAFYALGTGDHQHEEHLNAARSDWDDRDGRSADDFELAFDALYPVPSGQQESAGNCL